MRRPATSRFSSALSASIPRQISLNLQVAQRCHSSASRNSCTRRRGRRARLRDAPGSPADPVSTAAAHARRSPTDLPQRAIAGLQRDLLAAGQRLDLPADAVEPAQVILLDLRPRLLIQQLLFFERRDRVLEPFGRRRVGRCVLAQDVGIAPQPAPARHHFLGRLIRGEELLELGGQRLEPAGRGFGQHAPPLAILELREAS